MLYPLCVTLSGSGCCQYGVGEETYPKPVRRACGKSSTDCIQDTAAAALWQSGRHLLIRRRLRQSRNCHRIVTHRPHGCPLFPRRFDTSVDVTHAPKVQVFLDVSYGGIRARWAEPALFKIFDPDYRLTLDHVAVMHGRPGQIKDDQLNHSSLPMRRCHNVVVTRSVTTPFLPTSRSPPVPPVRTTVSSRLRRRPSPPAPRG